MNPSDKRTLEEREKLIQNIRTIEDLKKLVGPDASRFLTGSEVPLSCPFFAAILQEHEHLIREPHAIIKNTVDIAVTLEGFYREVNTALDTLAAQADILEQSRLRVERLFEDTIIDAKNAVRMADVAYFISSRRAAATDAAEPPVTEPTPVRVSTSSTTNDGRTILPTGPRHVVRPLSQAEVRHRRSSTCHLCGETGHWQCDHYSYRCTVCGLAAPGHNSGSQWCPVVAAKQQDDRNDSDSDSLYNANDYDDYIHGPEGDHNLNT